MLQGHTSSQQQQQQQQQLSPSLTSFALAPQQNQARGIADVPTVMSGEPSLSHSRLSLSPTHPPQQLPTPPPPAGGSFLGTTGSTWLGGELTLNSAATPNSIMPSAMATTTTLVPPAPAGGSDIGLYSPSPLLHPKSPCSGAAVGGVGGGGEAPVQPHMSFHSLTGMDDPPLTGYDSFANTVVVAPTGACELQPRPAPATMPPSVSGVPTSPAMSSAPAAPSEAGEAATKLRNVFVASLPRGFDELEMLGMLRQFGSVERYRFFPPSMKSGSTESRPYGFVLFDTPTDAEAAVRALHGLEYHGCTLKVQLSRNGIVRPPATRTTTAPTNTLSVLPQPATPASYRASPAQGPPPVAGTTTAPLPTAQHQTNLSPSSLYRQLPQAPSPVSPGYPSASPPSSYPTTAHTALPAPASSLGGLPPPPPPPQPSTSTAATAIHWMTSPTQIRNSAIPHSGTALPAPALPQHLPTGSAAPTCPPLPPHYPHPHSPPYA